MRDSGLVARLCTIALQQGYEATQEQVSQVMAKHNQTFAEMFKDGRNVPTDEILKVLAQAATDVSAQMIQWHTAAMMTGVHTYLEAILPDSDISPSAREKLAKLEAEVLIHEAKNLTKGPPKLFN